LRPRPKRGIMSEFITTAEAAELLGLEQATAQHYAAWGKFPGAQKFGEGKGGVWMIPLADVEAYAARRRSPGRPPGSGAGEGEGDEGKG